MNRFIFHLMKRIQIVTLIAFAMFSATGSANAEANEAKALAVIASDADTHTKAMACDTLGRVGTGKAVPALSELLGDECWRIEFPRHNGNQQGR